MPPPVSHRPSERQFWSHADPKNLRPSLPFLKEHFQFEGRLTEEQVCFIAGAEEKSSALTSGLHFFAIVSELPHFLFFCTLGNIHPERDNTYPRA